MTCPNTDNGKACSVEFTCSSGTLVSVTKDGDPVDFDVEGPTGGKVTVTVTGPLVNPIGAVIRFYCDGVEVACRTVA